MVNAIPLWGTPQNIVNVFRNFLGLGERTNITPTPIPTVQYPAPIGPGLPGSPGQPPPGFTGGGGGGGGGGSSGGGGGGASPVNIVTFQDLFSNPGGGSIGPASSVRGGYYFPAGGGPGISVMPGGTIPTGFVQATPFFPTIPGSGIPPPSVFGPAPVSGGGPGEAAINQQLAFTSQQLGRSLSQQEILSIAGPAYIENQRSFAGRKTDEDLLIERLKKAGVSPQGAADEPGTGTKIKLNYEPIAENATFSREPGINGRIYVTTSTATATGKTRLATAADFAKYGTSKEQIIQQTAGELIASAKSGGIKGVVSAVETSKPYTTIQKTYSDLGANIQKSISDNEVLKFAYQSFKGGEKIVFLPFSVTQTLINEGAAALPKTTAGQIGTGILEFGSGLIPTKTTDILLLGLGVKAYTALPKLTSAVFATAGVIETAMAEDIPSATKGVLTSGIGFAGLYENIGLRIPKKEFPTSDIIAATEPFTRQRATVLLTEPGGNYLLGRTKSGDIISFGGGIEKGEAPRTAALRELGEETGLTKNDITNFAYKGKVVFPEETHKIFTGTISDISKIKPSSDILELIQVPQSKLTNIFGNPITGQSALHPITRGGIRSYELGLINFAENDIPPNWLYIKTNLGKFYLGTQSRYNVPGEQQLKYLGEEELLLAHGTQQPAILEKTPFFEQESTITGQKTKRGQKQGLYLQPPITTKQILGGGGYIGLSYVGIGTAKESLGLKFGFPKREVLIFKEPPIYPISTTPKTLSGMESELIIEPGASIRTTGRAKSFSIEGKKVFVQQTRILRDIDISDKLLKLSSDISIAEKKNIIRDLKKQTGVDYSSRAGGYQYITPVETSTLSLFQQSEPFSKSISREAASVSRSIASGFEQRRPSTAASLSIGQSRQETRAFFSSPSRSISGENYYPSNTVFNRFEYEQKRRKKPIKVIPTYSTFIRKAPQRGAKPVFLPYASGVTKGQAIRLGSEKALGSLVRTFSIKKTGIKEDLGLLDSEQFFPESQYFREFKIKKGKKISTPGMFIQKRGRPGAALQSIGEKSELAYLRSLYGSPKNSNRKGKKRK
jgi:8-oxo-dGTP pyrophosphatase MutT (NUDIX family)